jgi:hypothetical protein
MYPEISREEYAFFKEWYTTYGMQDVKSRRIISLLHKHRSKGFLSDGHWNSFTGFSQRGYIHEIAWGGSLFSPRYSLRQKIISLMEQIDASKGEP